MRIQRAAEPGGAPNKITFNKAGTGVNVKIGYAFTNQWAIYTAGLIAGPTDMDEWQSAITGLAFSYYRRAKPKSVYFTAGYGESIFGRDNTLFEHASDNLSKGWGVHAGVGYEFRKHWSVEGTVMQIRTTAKHQYPKSTDTDVLAFMVTINVLGY